MADAVDRVVCSLLAASPDLVAVVGGGPVQQEFPAEAAGGLQQFGVDVTVGDGKPVLPLSLTVGRWLLTRAGVTPGRGDAPQVVFHSVDQYALPAQARKLGVVLAERAPRVGILAMGDASARRAREAPGAPDPQAQDYDEDVAEALAAVDTHWLGRLSPARDAELMVAGRASWQVLAGAAEGTRMHGRLLCMAAPYGVTYLAAVWHEDAALAETATS
ncbi:MAG TPA: hypothetical protein VGS19_34085 [Streptosporangiaceae bacterium]|nr:hypothetical protein [Streptosporangiaceae bacterium]